MKTLKEKQLSKYKTFLLELRMAFVIPLIENNKNRSGTGISFPLIYESM